MKRLPDLIVDTIVTFSDGRHQVQGINLDGEPVWILCSLTQDFSLRPHEGPDTAATDLPDLHS